DATCQNRRNPGCLTGGGGDTETAISKHGVVYFANQEVLANEAASVSTDHGSAWPLDRQHAFTSPDITNDRQWLAVYNDKIAWLAASSENGGISVVKTTDG